MLYGVVINGENLFDKYGLCLLADINIPTPACREIRYTIPGMDGTLDMSTALTGEPVFDDVEISFTVFNRMSDSELCPIRAQLRNTYHGKQVKIIFPEDAEHYFVGTLKIGDVGEYGSGKISMSLTAAPWRYRLNPTTVARSDLSTAYKQLSLPNERRAIIPTITVNQDTTLLWNGNTIAATTGTHRFPDIRLAVGDNILKAKVASGTGSITVEYQEASL